MGSEREAVRRLVSQMADAAGVDLTTLARQAGVAPSTLTRFMNKPVKHILSHRTLSKLAEASGKSLPSGLPDQRLLVNIGRRMRLVRQAMAPSYSDEAVADLCGWSIEEMEDIFAGRRCASTATFISFAKRMRVTTDFLLLGDPDGLAPRAISRLMPLFPELLADPEDSDLNRDTAQP
jgi:hypothetical protein